MEQVKKILFSKKLWFHVILAFSIVVFSYKIVNLCEAAARTDPETFVKFLGTDISKLVLDNASVLMALLIGALYLITTKISVAVGLVTVPFFACHVINAFKLTFRNEPFFPWDISLAGETTGILGSIELEFTDAMLRGIAYLVVFLAMAILADILFLKNNRPKYRYSIIAGVLFIALFLSTGYNYLNEDYLKENGIDVVVYDQATTYKQNGFFYSFVANIYHYQIEAPADYNKNYVVGIAEEYANEKQDTVKVDDPNIIIVMSEAFSDIWNAKNLKFDQEIAPNFTNLAEKYLSGKTMTTQYGGNTSNSEFEVLTSYSTNLLPHGTVPYMSYVNQKTDSYVSFLESEGYYTVALHPFTRSFFSREKAYELLDFDEFYSEEYFTDATRVRALKYVSDDSLTDSIITEYEKNRTTGHPFFCHTVTMQNHASFYPYDWSEDEKVTFTASCELTEEEYGVIQSYATGIRYSDAALGKLIEYFENVDEPTVILFFGDHQPYLGGSSYPLMQKLGYVDDYSTPEGIKTLQSTPYLIWNNFEDDPTCAKEDMSMLQLLPYMTRTLGMERPIFYEYMDSVYTQLRGITRTVYADGEGKAITELTEDQKSKYDEYLTIVYDGLLGNRYASDLLYSSSPKE